MLSCCFETATVTTTTRDDCFGWYPFSSTITKPFRTKNHTAWKHVQIHHALQKKDKSGDCFSKGDFYCRKRSELCTSAMGTSVSLVAKKSERESQSIVPYAFAKNKSRITTTRSYLVADRSGPNRRTNPWAGSYRMIHFF